MSDELKPCAWPDCECPPITHNGPPLICWREINLEAVDARPSPAERERGSKSELLRDHKQALAEWKEKHFRDAPKIGEELNAPSPSTATGLVERLEDQGVRLKRNADLHAVCAGTMREAAVRIDQQAAEIRRLTEVAQDWCRDARHNESVADEWKRQYEKEHERAEKFMWQVRDTCARAEQAERERDEAREALHYANGTAELAMKHRDTAEARVKELEEWQKRENETQEKLQAIGEQFGAFGGELRTDAMRRLLTEANARNGELRDALIDATAHLAAATSSYKRFCRKGVTGDALFSTKLSDYEKAEARARAVLRKEG